MSAASVSETVWRLTRDPLPLPGRGDTASRFETLAAVGSRDLCVAKLFEPHHDALAILADLGSTPPTGDILLAVWAAEPPHAKLRATRSPAGWQLTGMKAFCSGAEMVTHALVTAGAGDGDRLFLVDVVAARDSGAITLDPDDWTGAGMRRAGTRTLRVRDVPGEPIGRPREYVDRPGFWHGAVGVAACWLGGARAVADLLRPGTPGGDLDPHRAVQLGAVTSVLDASTAHLLAVARAIDLDPSDQRGLARRQAQSVRATVAASTEEVMTRTAHALGPAPLAFNAEHSQRVADLQVFIRQHHAERDLEELGRIVAGCRRMPL